jgi:3-oxoisoapionate decarboxylase
MTRREILAAAGAAPAFLSSMSSLNAQSQSFPRMGGAPTAFQNNMRAAGGGMRGGAPPRRGPEGAGAPAGGRAPGEGRPRSSFDAVEHCRKMGMGGVQTNPPSIEPAEIKKFRARLESLGMHLVCDPRIPNDASGLAQFEAEVIAYKEAGAHSLHASITGRRYEEFDGYQPWRAMFDRIQKQAEMIEPILRKHRIAIGFENHKGYRAPEQAAWLKRLGSEWVGVCLDFGNNLSLCEHPMDTARILLPYTVNAHIKDMGMEPYEDGYLLSEVVLGEGVVDLKAIVDMCRQKDPKMPINLEMITRDPLKIPIYTEKYWATFQNDSSIAARDVAKVVELIQKNKPKSPLPRTTGMPVEEQVKLEDKYNLACVDYGRKNLSL